MKKWLLGFAALACILFVPGADAQVFRGNIVDISGTVTAGAASQQILAADPNRRYIMCQNPIAATEPLFVNFGAAASTTTASYELAAGGSVAFTGAGYVPMGTVNITAVTTGHRFVCKWG